MTDFTPGPGWHQVPDYVPALNRPKQRLIMVYGPGKPNSSFFWLEDKPVELPTIAGAYIGVQWTSDYAASREAVNNRFILKQGGNWLNIDTSMIWHPETLSRSITGFTSYYIPEV